MFPFKPSCLRCGNYGSGNKCGQKSSRSIQSLWKTNAASCTVIPRTAACQRAPSSAVSTRPSYAASIAPPRSGPQREDVCHFALVYFLAFDRRRLLPGAVAAVHVSPGEALVSPRCSGLFAISCWSSSWLPLPPPASTPGFRLWACWIGSEKQLPHCAAARQNRHCEPEWACGYEPRTSVTN